MCLDPEILCPPPVNVTNAKREGGSYKFGAIVCYGCNEKMRFEDGVTSKNISCVGSGMRQTCRVLVSTVFTRSSLVFCCIITV